MPELKTARFGKLLWLFLSLAVVLLDQATKLYFEALFTHQDGMIVIIPGYLAFHLAYNSGAAFSFLAGASGWQRWFFVTIAVVVSAVLVIWLKRLKAHETWVALALALILGGAIGNLIDRIAYGQVIDFILVHWQNRWYFPTFNLADAAISVGAAVLILDMLRAKPAEH